MLKQFTDNNLLIHEKELLVRNKNLKDRNSQTKSKRVDKEINNKVTDGDNDSNDNLITTNTAATVFLKKYLFDKMITNSNSKIGSKNDVL